MANLVTIDDIRNTSGATTELIADAKITDIITKSQAQALSSLKIFTEPTKQLEIRDGNGKNSIKLNKPYVWKVLKLETVNTEIDLDNITIEPISSIITIDNTQNPYYFYPQKNSVKIKYLSAFMEKTTTITETTADIEVGTSVDISVDSETGFSDDDWVLIEGLDGKREATKITGTDTGEITVDELVQDHEADSVITLLQTHELLTQYILYDTSTNVANYIVGNTSNLPTSWSQEGESATIGVAYTHWRESADKFAKKRDEFKSKILAKLNPIA